MPALTQTPQKKLWNRNRCLTVTQTLKQSLNQQKMHCDNIKLKQSKSTKRNTMAATYPSHEIHFTDTTAQVHMQIGELKKLKGGEAVERQHAPYFSSA